jgi:two-component system sensor histidine kinase KdpD
VTAKLLLRNRATRFAVAFSGALLVALVLVAVDADLAAAAIVLMLAVVGASLLGYAIGLAVAIEAFVLLTYLFAPPKDSFAIDQVDDVVALVAFVAVSVIFGAVVARLNDLRERAALAAREAEVRVEATSGLLAGADASHVGEVVCRELVDLFDLTSCELVLTEHPPELRMTLGRPLQPYERSTLDALEAGLRVAFDRARLDAEAREHRVAAEIDRSRASFLAAITHDLRTPLATIKAANAALLASGDTMTPEDRRDLIDASYQEAARLEQLVTVALEITRIRSGGLRPEPVAVSLGDLVRAATRRLRPLSSDRDIALDISPELPANGGAARVRPRRGHCPGRSRTSLRGVRTARPTRRVSRRRARSRDHQGLRGRERRLSTVRRDTGRRRDVRAHHARRIGGCVMNENAS